MENSSIYFFYNGVPYKKDIFLENEEEISGISVWDNISKCTINKSAAEFCKEDDIEKIFIEKCKEVIKLNLSGWTSEKAVELEEKGKKYLTEKWKYYLLDCPNRVYKACQEGNYGIHYKLSIIDLPEDLKIGNKPCSDGKLRNNKKYIKYLLGDDWSLIRLFMIKWPMLKFKYEDFSKADEPFPDIYCMIPFCDDPRF